MSVEAVADKVKEILATEGSGHDWEHVHRVWQNALKLAEAEGADKQITSYAALLHDIDDRKVTKDFSSEEKLPTVRRILNEVGQSSEMIEHICNIIKSTGYSKSLNGTRPTILEAQILSDADFLEAIGAIGIARCLTYGGHMGRPIFVPEWFPVATMSQQEYLHGRSASINHFFDKLLKLRTMFYTHAGKAEAEIRHQRMKTFLNAFFEETFAPSEWGNLLKKFA